MGRGENRSDDISSQQHDWFPFPKRVEPRANSTSSTANDDRKRPLETPFDLSEDEEAEEELGLVQGLNPGSQPHESENEVALRRQEPEPEQKP